MKKKFSVSWNEHVENNCYVEIEAESAEEALEKWHNDEYEEYDRDEASNSFEAPSLNDIREVKPSSLVKPG